MLTISLWTGDKSWAAAALPTTSLIGRDRGGCVLIGRRGAGGYDEIYRVIRRPWWGHFSKQSHSSIETELPPICNSLSGLASHGRGASLDRGHDLGPFWQLVTTIGPRTSPLSNLFLVSTIGNKVAFSCCSKKTFGKNEFSSETERLRDRLLPLFPLRLCERRAPFWPPAPAPGRTDGQGQNRRCGQPSNLDWIPQPSIQNTRKYSIQNYKIQIKDQGRII